MSRYLVGIDLGTTHTVVAYHDTQQHTKIIQLFPIEQLVNVGEVASRPLLPSVRYHPADGELQPETLQQGSGNLAFTVENPVAIFGEFAQQLGAKSQGRLIHSAKSWLSHTQVDRTAPILPWGGAEGVAKISPLHASASYLAYIRTAWNQQFPHDLLEQQDIVLTVPASFDEGARRLTVTAAQLAGLPTVHLLEEPQAACYDWLHRHQTDLHNALRNSRLLLVCDVGGGTTDLTLIKIQQQADELPKLTRIGVGEHLMLGGDNMDLALAHLAESRLMQAGNPLNSASLAQLMLQTRWAKEQLLAEAAPEQCNITLLGTGSRLIGNAKTTTLRREEVRNALLEGFFPSVSYNVQPQKRRAGLVEFGLPFAQDPAITRHIAHFLAQHALTAQEALGITDNTPALPDTVLCNGGVFNSPLLQKKLLNTLGEWHGQALHQLDNPHPDLAVAYGAVAYSLARRGQQLKIGGGSARSYFLALETETTAPQGICLLPKGTEESTEIRLENNTFALNIGQPVQFHLYATTHDIPYQAGELANINPEIFSVLPPLIAVIDTQQQKASIPVLLSAALSEVGTVAVQCSALDNPAQHWQLEFQLRGQANTLLSNVIHPRFAEAIVGIENFYGTRDKATAQQSVKNLRNELEKVLGQRDSWDTVLLRQQADVWLAEALNRRRRSADHERLWLNLTGFCLRPGMGYPLDEWRVQQLWAIYPQGIQYKENAQNWAEWWTIWRRVAGGLSHEAQQTIYQSIKPYFATVPKRFYKQHIVDLKKKGYEEVIRLVASLEQLDSADKIDIGNYLLTRLQQGEESNHAFWAIGRIGARVPSYGSVHYVVPVAVIENWLQILLQFNWKTHSLAGFATTLLARMSGDRERDINPTLRQTVISTLQANKAPATWIALVQTVSVLDEGDAQKVFGESLPLGLRLL
ncbi:Hsp70 family protein [Beggiatoa leptomitoformis]|uniref:Hsp70 family protein n=1 Tax=Beggiatoa leptomitoformis TaxID=288004 RepID=A0A2N9YA78_9GAMM|nr:Hsp70 family protein [Beggiatoa leptomitoformis]ALG67224.1 Hsp70 family protein [Beggiatoa leptomitoformis]AUI67363.1 Hsp70 family protein [Beggiatoa leptomitoformis]